jgi:hypothetical protein
MWTLAVSMGRVHLRFAVRLDLRFDLRFGHANACDAPGQGILLRWRAIAGTESQVKTQVDRPLSGCLGNLFRLRYF